MGIDFSIEELTIYMLVFCRMGGVIFLNPLLSRKNVPAQFKIALVLGLTLFIAPMRQASQVDFPNTLLLMAAIVREISIGVGFGFIFQVFYYLLFMVGDIVDMGFGLSMAKAFDPGTNLQVSITGNLLQFLFALYFFTVDGHLILIRMAASTFDFIELGAAVWGSHALSVLIALFVDAFSLVMHLALPFIAASFILEIAMGVLMKLIPQINVFSLHFQIKIIFGFLLLFLFSVPISGFLDQYLAALFASMKKLIAVL